MRDMELELEKAVIEESSVLKKAVSALTSDPVYVRHRKLEELSKVTKSYFVETVEEILKK